MKRMQKEIEKRDKEKEQRSTHQWNLLARLKIWILLGDLCFFHFKCNNPKTQNSFVVEFVWKMSVQKTNFIHTNFSGGEWKPG
jgi:hypothetical protein